MCEGGYEDLMIDRNYDVMARPEALRLCENSGRWWQTVDVWNQFERQYKTHCWH